MWGLRISCKYDRDGSSGYCISTPCIYVLILSSVTSHKRLCCYPFLCFSHFSALRLRDCSASFRHEWFAAEIRMGDCLEWYELVRFEDDEFSSYWPQSWMHVQVIFQKSSLRVFHHRSVRLYIGLGIQYAFWMQPLVILIEF